MENASPSSPAAPSSLVDDTPRAIGEHGLTSGPLAFGCWRFTDDDLATGRELVVAAVDRGLNLVDTADVYGLDHGGQGFGQAEELLGRVLDTTPGLRERIVLATKGGIRPPVPYDSSPRALRDACESSLRRLRVETIDLYQLHRPDVFTHPAEVAQTLAALRLEGKIREVGVSNMTAAQIETLAEFLPFPIATVQPELSALQVAALEDGTLDLCLRRSITPLAWSPLAGGRLLSDAGGSEAAPAALTSLLDDLAAREGVNRAAVAIAFVLAHPSRPVAILGTQTIERIEAAIRATTVHLDRADVYAIVEASTGQALP